MKRGDAYRRGVRISLTVAPVAARLLRRLYETGLYGVDGVAGVAREMVYRGLREALPPPKPLPAKPLRRAR